MNKHLFYFFTAVLIAGCKSMYSQKSGVNILLPYYESELQQKSNFVYVPELGFNVYNKPSGDHIGRIRRDPKGTGSKNYDLNLFICPKNRAPELYPNQALAPLGKNTYAIPVIKQSKGFVLLFDTIGPYHYWAEIKELKKLGFVIKEWPHAVLESEVETEVENSAGIIVPDFNKLTDLKREFLAYLPERGLPLYSAPAAKKVATLGRFCPVAKFSDGNFRMYILSDSNNCLKHITVSDLYHLTDETYAIPYYKYEKDYVLLFTYNTVQYWASVNDINSKNYKVLGWKNYFIENKGAFCWANADSLVLKEGPYEDGKDIVTLNTDTHAIEIIGYDGGFCEGAWCKVRVTIYKENPCRGEIKESENVIKKVEGWIKLIDKKGLPTVHINTKGC